MKVLFGMVDIGAPLVRATMSTRQTTGFVERLLRQVGLDWSVPDFSSLSRRQKTVAVNIPYRGCKGLLHLLIDSTGIKVEGEGEWRIVTGPSVPRTSYPTCSARSRPTRKSAGVSPANADGAYGSRKCYDAIADCGAHAIIPPHRIGSSRTRKTMAAPWTFPLLTGTKRIVGCIAASQMASALAASSFWRLT